MKKLLGVMLLAGGSLFAAPHFSIGIGVGAPAYYPPSAEVAVQPPYPGSGYTWVDGYWAPGGAWVAGYWAPPAYYEPPTYYAPPAYYGARGNVRMDRDRDRGWNHERDEHYDRGRGHDEGFRR